MMKEYKNYLLDWDGCLGQTLEVWLEGYGQTYSDFGIPQTDEEIAKFSFNTQHGPLARGIDDLEAFMDALMGRINEDLKTVGMYEGAREFIGALKAKGYKVALITSSPRSVIDSAIAHNRLGGMFDAVVTGDEVDKHKPDPEIIYKALADMSLTEGALSETVIVGDSKSDLGAANNAGIDSILFYPKTHKIFYDIELLNSFKPTYTFEDFASLTEAVA